MMSVVGEASRLTLYVGGSDVWHGRNLAIAIVERCRELGIAGATVSRGVLGYGRNSRIRRARAFGLSRDLPERVEIIDAPEAIERLIPILDEMIAGGLMVVEPVRVLIERPEPGDSEGSRGS